jgi:hypothetical protein
MLLHLFVYTWDPGQRKKKASGVSTHPIMVLSCCISIIAHLIWVAFLYTNQGQGSLTFGGIPSWWIVSVLLPQVQASGQRSELCCLCVYMCVCGVPLRCP